MRNKSGYRKLSKPTDQRLALIKNSVLSLMEYTYITTTDARAKEVRKMAEKLITIAKKDQTFVGIRKLLKVINNKKMLQLFSNEKIEKFKGRPGGYTRIIKLSSRRGDGAQMSKLELVDQV